MPTAGRATGALLFAVLAFAVARLIASGAPADLPPGRAAPAAALMGGVCGWRLAGAPGGGAAAAGRGITAALAAAFCTALLGALWQMGIRALRGLYRDPVEALAAVAGVMLDFARLLVAPLPLTLLLGGGAVAGLVAGAVARRLP